MKKRILTILIASAMTVSAKEGSKVPAIDVTNFDEGIALNEDFYQHFTGGWQAKNPLKPEYSRYGAFDVLAENNEKRINDLFTSMTKNEYPEGSTDRKITDLYTLGLDSVRLNKEGAEPVKNGIKALLAIKKRSQLTEVLAQMHRNIAAPFFGISIGTDLMNSNEYALYAGQSGLIMGNRDYYLDDEHQSKREAYVEYLKKLFTLAGMNKKSASAAADATLRIETALAEKMWSKVELRNVQAQYNPLSRDEFFARYGGVVDWQEYFNRIGIPDFDRIIVMQPSALDNSAAVMSGTPVEDIRCYLAALYLDSAASFLSDDFTSASFEFHGRTMSGAQQQRPRWKRAMAVPNGVLSEAVGKMYVELYFPESDKQRMSELVRNLQKALGEHIDALEWMSDETKSKAREKLAAFTVKIGYPDKWKDYSDLKIDASKSYWENIVAARDWAHMDDVSKYGKPVDRDEWFMSPQTVNAYYNPTTNEICFPAAILQPPFYNPDADDAVNYGAIGVVIGHEMTHGFDDQGRNFDKDGNMNNWWTEADSEAFKSRTEVLVKQFDAIEVLPGIHANGSLTIGENIADQGGLRVAYTALQNTVKDNEPAPIDGYTAAQRFYIAYATLWGQNIRDTEVERLTKVDVHSLGKWRVNATLRNLQTFCDAFGITEGAMYMPEEERVIIW
ncbi:MAG: M13 family metallopeptidase [Alistipes sp.]|nr:M13 family metallopeptidase [Alistipes sp.]